MEHFERNNSSGTREISVISTCFTLFENKLQGSIPRELGELKQLQNIDLSINYLKGIIPLEFQNLTYLEELLLFSNYLEGHIPYLIGYNSNLSVLDIADSNLVGNIPPYLCKYEKLMLLGLGSNWLFGNIHPFGLKTCKSLEHANARWQAREFEEAALRLDLSRNQFAGSVPEEIGKLVDVELLKISDNRLTGEIPRKLQLLESLYLNDNRLVGDVPTSFSELISLLVCNLSNNNLVGPVPHNPAFLRMDSTKFAGYNGSCKSGSYRCHPVIPIFYV
ncbi:hypothetical protein OIU76_019098 [Salix suchowensis]|nr:hypothetical protein OIU76_019098 [Salix suchowensis]